MTFIGGNCPADRSNSSNETNLTSGSGGNSSGGGVVDSNSTNTTVTLCGESAVATAVIVEGLVISFSISSGGANYTSAPTVALSGGGCAVQAEAEATIDLASGVVIGVAIRPSCLSPGGNWNDRYLEPLTETYCMSQ